MNVRMYMFYVAIVFCYAICIACTAFLILRAAVWPVAPFAYSCSLWTMVLGALYLALSRHRPFALVPLAKLINGTAEHGKLP